MITDRTYFFKTNLPFFISFAIVLLPQVILAQGGIFDTVKATFKHSKIAGGSAAVIRNGLLLCSLNYGYSDIEQQKPILAGTTFNIMSLSKNFIACSVMQLVNKKQINLDEPVTHYISNLPKKYDSVKVYQMLNHSSGVPDYVHVSGYMQQANKKQSPLELLSTILNYPLEFTPGTKSSYSNSNYILLGLMVENVSHETLGDYLRKNIFDPLDMEHTYLDDGLATDLNKAKGYALQNGQLIYQPPLDPSQYWAAGGIVSTVNDLILYNKALKSGRIVPLFILTQMMMATKLEDGSYGDYGFGFELMQTPGLEIAGNTGAGLGYNAAYINFLKDSITVIVLTNTSNGNSAMIAKKIHDILVPDKKSAVRDPQDRLDSIVSKVFRSAVKGNSDPQNFENAETYEKFKQNAVAFIQQQGGLLSLEQNGQKVNPESIVRRYKINFEHNSTIWVIIFSKGEKIIAANHM